MHEGSPHIRATGAVGSTVTGVVNDESIFATSHTAGPVCQVGRESANNRVSGCESSAQHLPPVSDGHCCMPIERVVQQESGRAYAGRDAAGKAAPKRKKATSNAQLMLTRSRNVPSRGGTWLGKFCAQKRLITQIETDKSDTAMP